MLQLGCRFTQNLTISNGTANAGYAVIHMVISLACLAGYRTFKNKEN